MCPTQEHMERRVARPRGNTYAWHQKGRPPASFMLRGLVRDDQPNNPKVERDKTQNWSGNDRQQPINNAPSALKPAGAGV